jgi:transcription elongation factor Elf1
MSTRPPKSTWNETCPTCGAKNNLYDAFVSKDYNTEFRVPCQGCGRELLVEVHSVPEFEVTDAAASDQHQRAMSKLYAKGATA